MEKKDLFNFWFTGDVEMCDEIIPAGSPNRSLERTVIRDQDENLFIAEGFSITKMAKQTVQNNFLEFLQCSRLPGVYPYLRTRDGGHGAVDGEFFWQIRPFMPMDELPRTQLGELAEFGKLWGEFLLAFRRITAADIPELPNERFYFSSYVPLLRALIIHRMPQILRAFDAVVEKLSSFLSIEHSLPAVAAHGDFHPGNILMSGGKISSVIDWEFAGLKCAGYDPALLLGCLGMDKFEWLGGKTAEVFRQILFEGDFMPEISWEHFFPLMAAIRVGWLGEWVDMGDRELADREIEYINTLIDF